MIDRHAMLACQILREIQWHSERIVKTERFGTRHDLAAGDLEGPDLDLRRVELAALDELVGRRDALAAVALHELQQTLAGGLARLDAGEQDVRGVVGGVAVGARVGAVEGLELLGEGAAGLGGRLARAGEDGALGRRRTGGDAGLVRGTGSLAMAPHGSDSRRTA